MWKIKQLKQAISKLDEHDAKALLNLIFICYEQYEQDEIIKL